MQNLNRRNSASDSNIHDEVPEDIEDSENNFGEKSVSHESILNLKDGENSKFHFTINSDLLNLL